MAPYNLYTLNPTQDNFWDFITSLNDPAGQNQQQTQAGNQRGESGNAESSEKKQADKQPTVEDEIPAESSSQEKGKGPDPFIGAAADEPEGPSRPRGRCGGKESSCGDGPRHCHGRRGGRGGFGGFGSGPFGHHGPPPPFMMGHGSPPPPFRFDGPEGPHGPTRYWRDPARDGPYSHSHGHPHGGPRRGPRGPRRGNLNVNDFLGNLGSRLGLDLSGVAGDIGSGLERFVGRSPPEGVDFEPHADIFDTPAAYLVHLSLAGAKKSDLGVDWDGENSVLRVAGVVHRPGVDEATLKALAVDGRKNEVGVFEKKVRLGSKQQPARIDVAAINAKMTDGVLVVTVPKVERETTKREVPIDSSSSGSPSPTREAATQDHAAPLIDLAHREKEPIAAEMEIDHADARSPTEQGDLLHNQDNHEEQLPVYKEDGQQDQVDSEEEADYVKIDVK